MPSGKVAKPDITDNKDGTVTVKYAPTEAGLHEMDIKYDGIHIPGTTSLQEYKRGIWEEYVGEMVSHLHILPSSSLCCHPQEVLYSSTWTT